MITIGLRERGGENALITRKVNLKQVNLRGLLSKETAVLYWWGAETIVWFDLVSLRVVIKSICFNGIIKIMVEFC